ncbi:hypothetical protein [Paraburkholderia aromaticivorans]|uniref:Uncharacterized protein n=1 Tax=Paraburkholderia aromaticivorans TaxID=2026199 RepID=A0A248VLK2_9BURK|nr:hypothetical protein [Paraburkholderia aromaticivorans]ASV99895.1 hypothetical protein CJU94_18145 [Paraburkholderia aromaticivorans]
MTAINSITNTSFHLSNLQAATQHDGPSQAGYSTFRALSVEKTRDIDGGMQRADAKAAWHAVKESARADRAENPDAVARTVGDTSAQDPDTTPRTAGADASRDGGSLMDIVKQVAGVFGQLLNSVLPMVAKLGSLAVGGA